MNTLKKIVVIGPESTGKSTLCEQLAQHFKTLWVPEFARDFLETKSLPYTYNDLLIIAKGQIDLEEKYLSSMTTSTIRDTQSQLKPLESFPQHPLLFIDTDMYVMQVWSEFVFGSCHNWILRQIAARKYDLYLLCNVDLPWIKDELREYPDLAIRKKLYQYYKEQMVNQYTPWIDINGNYDQRLKLAIDAIENTLY